MRDITAAFSSAVNVPFFTRRSRPAPTAAKPRSSAASETSTSDTASPAAAHTCAMPLPIWPAPTMPTCSRFIIRSPSVVAGAVPLVLGAPARAIEHAGHHEHQVGEAVEILAHGVAHGLAL